MSRTASHSSFDAVIDLFPPREIPDLAYVLLKRTYALNADGGVDAIAPEPLFHDVRDETVTPRLLPGSDFWPFKPATDVVVQGSAFARHGIPVQSMHVSVQVGDRCKRVAVFGRRLMKWTRTGKAYIEAAEPFTEMPLTYENAYGGCDRRVPVSSEELDRLEMDHPGLNPRNLLGKGYVVLPDPVEGVELPNLEDPDDLLTAERLVVGAPELWYRQPLPWCFDWLNPLQFPRCAYLGLNPWFPAPQDERLPEVRRGYLMPNYRAVVGHTLDLLVNTLNDAYLQEASLGMVFENLAPGTPVVIDGMHPNRPRIAFSVPQPPRIEIELAGHRRAVTPRLTNVVIRPAEERLCLVYSAFEPNLHLTFIPGIHATIPLVAYVDGLHAIPYVTPATVRQMLKRASGEVGNA